MWTALVLVWISSLSLSESQVLSQDARHLVLNKTDDPAEKNASVTTVTRVLNGTSETMTAVTPSPVPSATGTLLANASSPAVTAGRTLRINTGTEGDSERVTSRAPLPPAPVASQQTPSSTAISVPHTPVPSGSPLPGTAALTTLAISAQPAAGTVMTARSPTGTQSPSQQPPGNSTASPMPPSGPQALNVSTPAPAVQASTAWPAAGTASAPTPALANTVSEPARPPAAPVAPVATTAVAPTTAHGPEPTTSTVPAPVPHASPTPKGEATSPTTRPSPAPSTHGAPGPGTSRTPGQVLPESPPGTASSAPTAPGGAKMPTTDLCPLSSQGPYLVVTTRPLTPSLVNQGFLLAVLLLGVSLFLMVLVLFALQAYESYRKKEYTQVDYLINGMYADSEM